MAHLICEKHGKRSTVTSTGQVMHRSNAVKCDGTRVHAWLNGLTLQASHIQHIGKVRSYLNDPKTAPMVKGIFAP
jgi:hypothetical protein